jgi:hypothetical protein
MSIRNADRSYEHDLHQLVVQFSNQEALDQLMLTRDLPIISQICSDAAGLPENLFRKVKKQDVERTSPLWMNKCLLSGASFSDILAVCSDYYGRGARKTLMQSLSKMAMSPRKSRTPECDCPI